MLLLKINLLLWGLSGVFAAESTGTSIPDILAIITTTEPGKQTVELIGAHHETASHTPAGVNVSAATAAAAQTTIRAAAETEEASDSHANDGMVAVVTIATTVSSSGTQLRHSSPASSEAPISDTTKPTTVQFEQKTTTTPPVTTSTTHPESTPTTEPQLTSKSSPTTSTTHSTQSLGSPSAFPTSTATVNSTSESHPAAASTSTPEHPPTSQSFTRTPTSTPGHPTTSQPSTRIPTSTPEHPTTSQPSTKTPTSTPDAGRSSSPTFTTTSISTNSTNNTSITIFSTIPVIIINPKIQPTSTTKPPPPPTTTEPTQSCSTRATVRQCLIVVASLACLATIFMVTTIVLCTKLSARKYRTRRPRQDTEMMCISSLLPDKTYNYTRQHNHITNGVLVMHRPLAHDDDSEDNVTLSSFLPENDRYV